MKDAPSPARPRPVLGAAMRQAFLLGALAAAATFAVIRLNLEWKPSTAVRQLAQAQLRDRPADFLFIDVRSADRFEASHVAGALHFEEGSARTGLEEIRARWDGKRRIVVYGEGQGSERATRVALLLKKEFSTREVYLLEGGWAAWPRP